MKRNLLTMQEFYWQAAAEIETADHYIGACNAFVRVRKSVGEHYKAASLLKRMMRPRSLMSYWLGDLDEQGKERRIYCLLLAAQAWRDFQ